MSDMRTFNTASGSIQIDLEGMPVIQKLLVDVPNIGRGRFLKTSETKRPKEMSGHFRWELLGGKE